MAREIRYEDQPVQVEKAGGISIVVTIHNEGSLLAKCIASCRRALKEADGYFTSKEILLICDKPDEGSWEIANILAEELGDVHVYRTDFGDPGLSRNFGTSRATGEFVTFVDGDDLINKAYLRRCLEESQRLTGRTFLRPRICVTFGDEKAFLLQFDSRQIVNNEVMIYSNPWAMPVFGRRVDFLAYPFEADDKTNGFSHEDWEWNLTVLHAGMEFVVVEGCIYFARRRKSSRTMAARSFQYVTRPLDFYRNKEHFTSTQSAEVDMTATFVVPMVGQPDSEAYFHKHPRAMRGLREGRVHSALDHYLRFGRSKGYTISRLVSGDNIGKFVANATIESMVCLSDLDGALDPFTYWRGDVAHYDIFVPDRNTFVWRDILSSGIFDRRWDVVFVLPWIRRGGADLVALKHIRSCIELGLSVCIITTLDATNEWSERMPPGVFVLPLGEVAREVSDWIKLEIFHRLLIELRPKAIHNVNSELFWQVLRRNGLSVRSNTKVICSLYCQDYNAAGSSMGYDRYIDTCDRYIDNYVTDNGVYAHVMTKDLGVRPAKIVTVRYPIELGRVNFEKRRFTQSKRVLWASRLDFQKGFDLLHEVAARTRELEFHFFGEAMLDDLDILEIEMPRNLVYRGKFSHVEQINPDEFDCFLYTARWDGLPNIVLEMGLKGLPVVSFTTGGLSDILSEDTGWPVHDVTADALRDALQAFYLEEDQGRRRAQAMQKLLRKQHKASRFLSQTKSLYAGRDKTVVHVNGEFSVHS